MQPVKLPCPHCQAVLRSFKPLTPGAQVKCVVCHKPFKVQPEAQKSSTVASYDGAVKLPLEVQEPVPAVADSFETDDGPLISVRRRRSGGGGILVLGLFLFLLLATGAGAGIYLLVKDPSTSAEKSNKAPGHVAVAPSTPASKPAKSDKQTKLPITKTPNLPKNWPPNVKREPGDGIMPVKLDTRPAKVDQAMIDKAINRGVNFLKDSLDLSAGTWDPPTKDYPDKVNVVGHAALPALALLECKVPPTDKAIQSAANYVRQNIMSCDETYDISCAVLLLDKLEDPADLPLLRKLAMRLIAAQAPSGAWPYKCPHVAEKDGEMLVKFLEQNRPKIDLPTLIADPGPGQKGPSGIEDKAGPPGKDPAPLPATVANLAVVKAQQKTAREPDSVDQQLNRPDNSNTQFALLGLWIARRHGVPVEASLKLASEHFRKTQKGDGGWPYFNDSEGKNPTKNTMTCVGLIALAMGHGATAEKFQEIAKRDGKAPIPPVNDPAIKDAVDTLVKYLGGDETIKGYESRLDTYLLWALERVGVLYQRDSFGKTEWYKWGARELLGKQEDDGRWSDQYHPAVSTSFALLFLKRSNLVSNLTQNLRSYLAIVDPDRR